MCLFLCEAMCVQWRPNKPQSQNPKPNALVKPQAICVFNGDRINPKPRTLNPMP